ncbi:sister chromatid cohesion protein PDS5 [Natrinema salsiterrestre]|uniref:HEAT repeat domain-containing protein n=1 Tax=Natrinema salsiterrestre TaxID=2950540 RepID=A0A9Q4KZ40_9EURY|nr:sister chromatid cohesion protein PDS5 [Natrinema salsiterrestre]MDF9744397.1 HEAT repeat domain-containing protein [Natrinema salsiterrestre]
MSDPDDPLAADRLTDLLHDGAREDVVARLERLTAADTGVRKRALRAARNVAEDRPVVFDGLADPLATFLTDDDRAVTLTTAKLFVTLAKADPTVVLPAVDSLAERLADDEAFYYVRARCAEALGYVALESPADVNDPEILADLRIGLSFDEPEVREKLAKALAYVALGDPSRLRHQVSSLAEHLEDDDELVRYHLCTALVAIGCENPTKLADAYEALTTRLADENPYVRGRAAEALGLLARAEPEAVSSDDLPEKEDSEESFAVERVRFARGAIAGKGSRKKIPGAIGTVEGVRDTTEDAVAALTAPDGDGECPHCGLALPENGPPMCPRCGAPY